MNTRYDSTTDSLYIEIRPLPAQRSVEIEADVVLDVGQDGKPVGYDIQHASSKRELIARIVLKEDEPQAAE